jgi:hypothetical protein
MTPVASFLAHERGAYLQNLYSASMLPCSNFTVVDRILIPIMNKLLHCVRASLPLVLVAAAIAYGPLHLSVVSNDPHPQGLGRLGRDLLRRGACELAETSAGDRVRRQYANQLR